MESEISTKATPENHDGQVKEDDDEVSYRKVFSQTIHLEGTWSEVDVKLNTLKLLNIDWIYTFLKKNI